MSGGGGYLTAPDLDATIPAACLPPTGEVAVFNPNGTVEVRLGGPPTVTVGSG